MPWYKWSKTPANNGNADPSINWSTGMSASSVEPSGRAMMTAGAQWRDDISGTITTGGTSTAYTVASNQVFDTLALMNGAMIAFVPHTTNGAVVTFNVDGLGAKPLRSSPSVEIGAGVLVQGTPYVVTYNNSDGAFYLQGFFGNPFNIPIGGLMPYLAATAPNANFVLPFGQAISRTIYATSFSLYGTTFGAGDGVNTFNVPDLRNLAIFGLGNMGGVDRGLITVGGGNFNGALLGASGGAQNHTLTIPEMPAHNHGGSGSPLFDSFGPTSFLYLSTQGGSFDFAPGSHQIHDGNSASATIGAQGFGNAHPIMPPAMSLPFILRVI